VTDFSVISICFLTQGMPEISIKKPKFAASKGAVLAAFLQKK
jgi:hypothetical protein